MLGLNAVCAERLLFSSHQFNKMLLGTWRLLLAIITLALLYCLHLKINWNEWIKINMRNKSINRFGERFYNLFISCVTHCIQTMINSDYKLVFCQHSLYLDFIILQAHGIFLSYFSLLERMHGRRVQIFCLQRWAGCWRHFCSYIQWAAEFPYWG